MESLVAIIILLLDIITIANVLKSPMEPTTKVLWIFLIVILPVLGVILYFLIGKKI